MKWIKCSERLPADCESVLIYCPIIKSMAVGSLIYHKGEPINYLINDFDESDSGASLKEITHWMLLPKPPEEE